MNTKPIIFYIDDEPHNLTVFEAALPETWEIHTFSNPMEAMEKIDVIKPWVVVSDQRMPGATGVQVLEVSKKIHPLAVRIIVTGYSDENLVIESVRKAQIFDYFRKPWDSDDLERSLQRAIDFYLIQFQNNELIDKIKIREKELENSNNNLLRLNLELEILGNKEKKLREELQSWAPPFVSWAIEHKNHFPCKKDLVGITFDIVESGKLHNSINNSNPIRKQTLAQFSELLLKYGGWRESHSGDSAYGHFGMLPISANQFESALAVAREFRVCLRNISKMHKVTVECGIAIHILKDSLVDIHQIEINTPLGRISQKSFDTTSKDIDLLHKMEKILHKLPGTNIIFSESFKKNLHEVVPKLVEVGKLQFTTDSIFENYYIIPSDLIKDNQLDDFFEVIKKSNSNQQVA